MFFSKLVKEQRENFQIKINSLEGVFFFFFSLEYVNEYADMLHRKFLKGIDVDTT